MKHAAILIATAALLASCNPDGSAPPTPGGATTPGSAPVSTKPMAATELKTFTATTTPQVQSAVTSFATNQVKGTGFLAPFSVGGKGMQAQSMGAAETDGCSTTSGDQTDGDRDGISVSGVTAYDCSSIADGYDVKYKGSTTERDKNDADPRSGYAYLGDFNGLYKINSSGLVYDWTYGAKYNLDVDTRAGGGYTARYGYGWKARGTYAYSGYTGSYDYDWILNMTMDSTPDADGAGTRVTYSGSASVKDDSTKLDGYTDFKGDVHYSDGKKGCYGIDSGRLTYTSGSTSMTITYTGCNAYKVD
ncbi:hypothetical protein ACFSR9_01865 [Deinococcus taklimakanensis]|uniref:Lipoprotein n=1 Tax=Deinococcus taklimakanensis TaxID=536443 RepID=A0ABW5P244_9DEIO